MPNISITDQILSAKSAAGVSYADLASRLNIDENKLSEIIFRRQQCSMNDAILIAKCLKQDKETFQELSNKIRPEYSAMGSQITKSVLDKLVFGLLASFIVFTFQSCQNSHQRLMEKAASSADAVSSVLTVRTDELIKFDREYAEKVHLLVPLLDRGPGTAGSQELISDLLRLEQSIKSAINVLHPFASSLEDNEHSKIFLNTLNEITKGLATERVPEDLDGQLLVLGENFREIVSTLQIDLRKAIENEYIVRK